MKKFVNRDEELNLIEDAVDILSDGKRLLRTPIIEFYGIEGIGKTTLLKKIQEKCRDRSLKCIWEDTSTSYRHLRAPKQLLSEKSPVVILVDSLDEANEEQLPEIEAGLSDLTESSSLFFVMASRKLERFDRTRTLMRKLTPVALKPFGRESCEEYFDSVERDIKPELRNTIYEWTRGYPLAMDVMVQAIVDKNLDTNKEQDRKQLISILTKKVIDQSILARSGSNYLEDQVYLLHLSVPRRFNLATMRAIIENFAEDFKLNNSLAYIALPDKINQATNALRWSMPQGGYSIDEPIRNICLMNLKILQPQKFIAINKFLAEWNERLAQEVSGPDRSRYLREYFYHLANSGQVADLPEILKEYMDQLLQQEETLDSFVQFYEEFLQDNELKEVLGENAKIVLAYIHKNLASRYRDFAEKAAETHQADYLRNFFLHTAENPEVKDFPLIFERELRDIRQQVSPDVYKQIIDGLSQREKFKSLLGEDFDG